MSEREQIAVENVREMLTPELLEQMLYLYRAEGVRVIDGDTTEQMIDVGDGFKRSLIARVYGVNAPEISKPTEDGEREAGEAARDWLKRELRRSRKDGFNFVRTFRDKRGKFGRLLIEFLGFRRGLVYSINAELIRQGHAVPYLLGPKSVAPTWLIEFDQEYRAHQDDGGDRWSYMEAKREGKAA